MPTLIKLMKVCPSIDQYCVKGFVMSIKVWVTVNVDQGTEPKAKDLSYFNNVEVR